MVGHKFISFFGLLLFPLLCYAQSSIELDLIDKIKMKSNDVLFLQDSMIYYNNFARKNNYLDLQLETSLHLAAFYLKENKIDNALSLYLEIEAISLAENKEVYFIKANKNLGDIYTQNKLHDDAISAFTKLIRIKENKELDRSEILTNISENYRQKNQIDSSLFYIGKAIQLNQKDIKRTVVLMSKKSDIYNETGQYEKSLENNKLIFTRIKENKLDKERAAIVNNIGYNYFFLKDYDKAISNFKSALKLTDINDKAKYSEILLNIAVANSNLRRFSSARNYLFRAKEILDDPSSNKSLELENLLAKSYLEEEDYFRAEVHATSALDHAQGNNSPEQLKELYLTSANVSSGLNDYEQALLYYGKHLKLRDSLEAKKIYQEKELVNTQDKLESTENKLRFLQKERELKESEIKALSLNNKNLQLESDALRLANEKRENELLVAKRDQELQNEKLNVQLLESDKVKNQLVLAQQKIIAEQKQRKLDSVEIAKRLEVDALAKEQEILKQEQLVLSGQKSLLEEKNKVNELAIEKQNNFRKFMGIIAALGLMVLSLILFGFFNLRKTNKLIKKERKRSDKLLNSILPKQTAEELKTKGKATPKQYENATVMFTDFSQFTKISAKMTPEVIIAELEACFSAFDEIAEQHNLERIKTIGDSYMCAGGLPKKNNTHAQDCLQAAVKMQQYMHARYADKNAVGTEYWKMRIGIHTGPVVAGVIGKNKFAYDIWGKTVNIASRLETACTIGGIRISETTLEMIKSTDSSFNCKQTGLVENEVQSYEWKS